MKKALAIIGVFIYGSVYSQTISIDTGSLDSLDVVSELQIDSLILQFENNSDSLRKRLQDGLHEIGNQKASIQLKIDSLSSLNLPTEKYTAKLDSLNGKANELVSSVNDKLERLKTSTIDKINELELPPN